MLVGHDVGQLRKNVVLHRECLQQWLSGRGGYAGSTKRSYRVRVQPGAVGAVVGDALGKSDELPNLPLQTQHELVHPRRLGRGDGIGVETVSEHRVDLELPLELLQVAARQPCLFNLRLILEAQVQRDPLRLRNPSLGSRAKKPQQAH